MKYFITLTSIIVFAMFSHHAAAQSGGFNVKNVNASEKVTVGSESDNAEITDKYIAFAPLSEEQISSLSPKKGMIVYNDATNYFQYWNGTKWSRFLIPADIAIPCASDYTDLDGNYFSGVQIGDQCWMDRNLKVTQYPNGDPIPYVPGNNDWLLLENGNDAFCYVDNNVNSEYGALYNYDAAIADNWTRDTDSGQGICPSGWHLPTHAEWTTLTNILGGGHYVAGGKLKEAGTSHWNSPNYGATNESRFTALPGGYRQTGGDFGGVGDSGHWWSANEYSSGYAWRIYMAYNHQKAEYGYRDTSFGFSVRCVRNEI